MEGEVEALCGRCFLKSVYADAVDKASAIGRLALRRGQPVTYILEVT